MDIFFDGLPVSELGEGSETGEEATLALAPELATTNGIATVYTTYDINTGNVIEQSELPRVIASPTGLVLRQDVSRRDLTYEDNQRYIKSW